MHPVIYSTVATVAAMATGTSVPPVQQNFDFAFPPCLGVVAADNPFHVHTVSDPGLPRVDDFAFGPAVVSVFHDAGSYTAIPSANDRVRSGRYDDRYEAVATVPVTYDSTGAIATARHLRERRDILLWDGRRFFFHEMWLIDIDNYNENTTVPQVTDSCRP